MIMIKNLLDNWKTTSAGLLAIAAAVLRLVFIIKAGNSNEAAWMAAIGEVLAGFGLLAAGDAGKSKKDLKEIKDQVAQAVVTGDTSILTNPAGAAKPTSS